VLIDATRPLGFGHILPRGLLREPPAGLARAHAVIITRYDAAAPPPFETSSAWLYPVAGRRPLAYTRPAWTGWRDAGDQRHELHAIAARRPYIACAIGNPAAFARLARRHFADLAGCETFADHHAFAPADIDGVFQHARGAGADAVIVTEKDWVKWRALVDVKALPLPVYRPELTIEFVRGSAALDELLASVLGDS